MRIAIYSRVSANGQSVEQTRELRDYTKRRGWKVAGEYTDPGIS